MRLCVARALVACVVIASISVASGVARADDTLAAEASFAEGRELMKQGRFAEACPKLEASYKLDPALGTLMNLAECLRQTQRNASAWLHYREAAAMARRASEPEREKIARDRASEIEPLLCRVTVKKGAAPLPPGLLVARDGEHVDEATLDVAVPIDPGAHSFAFSAPSRDPQSIHVDVAQPEPGAACPTQEIEVPQLPMSASAGRSSGVGDAPPESRWRTQHTLAVVAGVAGIAAAGVGTAFALSANSMKNDANAQCNPGCPGSARTELGNAGTNADIATVLFISGAAVITTGVVLWIFAPSLKAQSPVAFRF